MLMHSGSVLALTLIARRFVTSSTGTALFQKLQGGGTCLKLNEDVDLGNENKDK